MPLKNGLCELGVPGPLSAEIARQIANGTGDAQKLRELGFVPGAILASGITAGAIKAAALAEAGTATTLALFLAKSINIAPVNVGLPTITGTAQVGQVLTSTTGDWTSKTGITYARQWLAAGVAISGATAATYTPVAGDVGKAITHRVTATNANGATVAVSAATAAVIA